MSRSATSTNATNLQHNGNLSESMPDGQVIPLQTKADENSQSDTTVRNSAQQLASQPKVYQIISIPNLIGD
jgi:hypothetical protein